MTKVKRVFLSAFAGAVVIFIQAGVFYGFLFADLFANSLPRELAGVSKPATNYGLIFAADLLYAGMLTFVFAWLAGVNTFRRGALAGMVIGFLVVFHFDLISTATTYLTTPVGVTANVAISTVMSGLGGGVIAAMLGKLEGGSTA